MRACSRTPPSPAVGNLTFNRPEQRYFVSFVSTVRWSACCEQPPSSAPFLLGRAQCVDSSIADRRLKGKMQNKGERKTTAIENGKGNARDFQSNGRSGPRLSPDRRLRSFDSIIRCYPARNLITVSLLSTIFVPKRGESERPEENYVRTSAASPNHRWSFDGRILSSAANNEANEVAGIAPRPPSEKEIPADAESPLERKRIFSNRNECRQ